MEQIKYTDFTTDFEKMIDFKRMSKEDFLESYSYLTEEEYNLTFEKVYNTSSKVKVLETPRQIYFEQSTEAQLEINGKRVRVEAYTKQDDRFGQYDSDVEVNKDDYAKLTDEEKEEINEYLDDFDWGY